MIRQFIGTPPDSYHLVTFGIVHRDVRYFADQFGIRFTEDCDDLDFFLGALVVFNNNVCSLFQRKYHIENQVEVQFQAGDPTVFEKFEQFLAAAGLSREDVLWINDRYLDVPAR